MIVSEMEKFQFVDVYGVAVGYDDSVLVNKNLITAYVKVLKVLNTFLFFFITIVGNYCAFIDQTARLDFERC